MIPSHRALDHVSYLQLGSFEGRMWDLLVSVPDHCLSFYFGSTRERVYCFCLDRQVRIKLPSHRAPTGALWGGYV